MFSFPLCTVKKIPVLGAVDKNRNWGYVRSFMSWCEHYCSVKRDQPTDSFYKFLGTSLFTLEKLKLYPHNWDWEIKGKYLTLVASNHSDIRLLLRGLQLHWPSEKTPYGRDNLPSIVLQLLHWEETENARKYSTTDLFEYVILLRNCFKHYKKLPEEIKVNKWIIRNCFFTCY